MPQTPYTLLGLLANRDFNPEGKCVLVYLSMQEGKRASFEDLIDDLDLDIEEVHLAANSLVVHHAALRDNRSVWIKPNTAWLSLSVGVGVDTALTAKVAALTEANAELLRANTVLRGKIEAAQALANKTKSVMSKSKTAKKTLAKPKVSDR